MTVDISEGCDREFRRFTNLARVGDDYVNFRTVLSTLFNIF